MHRNENVRRMLKICLLVLLCNEMQSSFSHESGRTKNYINALNGHVASADAVKYHASIRLVELDGNFGEGHVCSGALIAPSVVLTAAHCLHNYESNTPRHPAEFRVVMGTLDRFKRTATTLVFGVTHLHRPLHFEPQTRRDNIGIMLLDHDVPDDQTHVQPIAFHMAQFYNVHLAEDAIFELTSWSSNAAGVPIKQLLALNVTKTSSDFCLQRYGTHYTGTLCMQTDKAQLADEGMAKACTLDDGAPLLHDGQLWALASNLDDHSCGSTEHGSGAGAGSGAGTGSGGGLQVAAPAVYTDVAYHTKWILDIIGTGHHQNSSIWGATGLLIFTLLTLNYMRYTKL